MALLFVDGFDHYATADITKKWSNSAGLSISSTGGRRGGGGLSHTGATTGNANKVINSTATLVVGVALSVASTLGVARSFIWFNDASTVQMGLRVNTDMTLSVMRGSGAGTVLATSVQALPAGFNYIEFKGTIHNTAGAYTVRVNGVTWLTGSAVNTRMTTNNSANAVVIGYDGNPNTGSTPTIFDDVYICDTTGSTNNDFLGDVRVDTLFPNGDGNYSQFTPSTGTDHYTLVDETAPNTTDYNDGATVGDRDSYTLQDLAALASQTVYGVQVNAAMLKDDAGAKSASTFVRSGGVNGDGASAALGTSQVYVSQVYETNPNGSVAWTETTVNAMEAGVRVTA